MKVVAALSGGVDSSAAAALAQQQGHEVIGVTLRLKHPDPDFSRAQLCAGKSDEEAVLSVTRQLGIEHHFLESYPVFEEKVLRPAADAYCAGETPNPCCNCNREVKFAALFDFAAQIGAGKVITGHYAKIGHLNGAARLRRGDDPAKDQSYFLYRLTSEQLEKLWFPIGELTKQEVRRIAGELQLPTAQRRDSQDACFQVPGECFGETLRRLFSLPARTGEFRYRGKTVGHHKGIHAYTLGQRKGLNVALGVPGYVAAIDPVRGNITLETDQHKLLAKSFLVRDLEIASALPETLEVQVRYRGRPVAASWSREGDRIRVFPQQPLRAVTPGQAAVFYSGDWLLGGGIIDRVEMLENDAD